MASKLLVVTRHSPLPENDGAGAYLFDLLSYLAQRGEKIEIVWLKAESAFLQRGWWRVPRQIDSVARITIIGSLAIGRFRFFWWGRIKAQFLGVVKSVLLTTRLWRQHPSSQAKKNTFSFPPFPTLPNESEPEWSALPSAQETRFFRERLRAFRPDAVLVNYCWLLPIVPRSHDLLRLVLTHDVASHRLNLQGHRSTCRGGEYSPATPQGESRLLELADVVLAISEDDAAAFRSMVPTRNILTVPKSAPLRPMSDGAINGRCLFVGGVNPPNSEGISWFLERIWPLIRQQRPDATLHVCGGICGTISNPPAGVTLRGRVSSLDAEYRQAQVVVVPLLQGTGVKIKLVEASGFGKACVTTPVGLQGLGFLRSAVLENVAPDEFAQSVVSLLGDSLLRHKLETETARLVGIHLASDRCYDGVRRVLQESDSARTTRSSVSNISDSAPSSDRKSLHGDRV